MPPVPPKNAGPVRDVHRFDEARLDTWMSENVEGYTGALQVCQFKGGVASQWYSGNRTPPAGRGDCPA